MTTVPGPLPDLPVGAESTVIGVQPDPARLARLAQLVRNGALTAHVGTTLALTDAQRAFTLALALIGHENLGEGLRVIVSG